MLGYKKEIHKNLSRLVGLTCCLLAICFFGATSHAGELSSFSHSSPNNDNGLIRLAAHTSDKPGASHAELQQLKKEMNVVFKILKGIIKDDSLTEEQKKEKVKV